MELGPRTPGEVGTAVVDRKQRRGGRVTTELPPGGACFAINIDERQGQRQLAHRESGKGLGVGVAGVEAKVAGSAASSPAAAATAVAEIDLRIAEGLLGKPSHRAQGLLTQ